MHSVLEALEHQSDEAMHYAPSEPQLHDPVSGDIYTCILISDHEKSKRNVKQNSTRTVLSNVCLGVTAWLIFKPSAMGHNTNYTTSMPKFI